MAGRLTIRRVDVTYLFGLSVAGFTVWSHEYNPGAFMFAAACLGLPSLYRWEAKRGNGNGSGTPRPAA